ncbi:hypothetical protein [Tenacibaculum ovolyticum]|uniref:hypothetical protein n=1 Tax=Tenacibaculum ovolyticum TaxID=104270 RepID=UPI001F358D9F|nr:hypothetical protein [Tenacibaculum ovolyticum]
MNNNQIFELKSALILTINHVDKHSNRELIKGEIKETLKQTTNHVQSINKQ